MTRLLEKSSRESLLIQHLCRCVGKNSLAPKPGALHNKIRRVNSPDPRLLSEHSNQ